MAVLQNLFFLAWALSAVVSGQYDGSRYAWYSSPASDFNSALPVGNGRLGGLIYCTPTEKISLNENSIWSGPFLNRLNPNAGGVISEVRSLLEAGNITGAGRVALPNMAGNPTSPQQYNPLGELNLNFGHSSQTTLQRWLDTYQGNSGCSYLYNGVNYTREIIANHPTGVLAVRLQASQAGQLNVQVSLSRSQYVTSNTASITGGVNSIVMRANSGNSNPISFTAEAQVVASGGSISASGSTLTVEGATTVDIFFDAESSYRYSSNSAWEAELARKLSSATSKGFPALRSAAIADNTALIGRVSLDLGRASGSAASLPTDQRLSNYKNSPNSDIQLVTLQYNMGRHLLVASSRDTGALSLPANLQGIWNEDFNPPWGSKYTININLEMNYWHAETTNLAEATKPFWDLLTIAQGRGELAASEMYRCDGFVLHHNIDCWGDPAPVDYGTPYTIWPMGGVWLSTHLMEHYRFTGNKTFLQETAWPILQGAAEFYFCYTFMWDGYYTAGPSLSPENSFIVPSNEFQSGSGEGIDISLTMDNSLLYQLFNDVIEACQILGLSSSDCSNAENYLAKIKPPQIGSYGQILEWRQEYGETEPGMRHLSPLFGLYPGSQMTPAVSPSLAAAAGVLLNHRMQSGSGDTGWSRAWVIACYARLFNGDSAWASVQTFLQTFTLTNMFNSNNGPPMQIDGNFGFTAGVTELFLQSHANIVHLLPALPSSVPTGSITGLVARGGFVVDIYWSGGALTNATITSNLGGTLTLKVANAATLSVNGETYTGPINTTAGGTYTVTLDYHMDRDSHDYE
ncbi:glycoside hydrolase family 95 protein [Oidiodendron maius Zn]|uniref:Glycoside hydrolase family 95 protein n=1 Tax=Oidiodendron maius (strain Zn) TaxID=913774 RepID=A0A0C3CIC1_OIDMZ|nr:glycoside hydrolase family 95 protein [Oidiodendron maius Zn]